MNNRYNAKMFDPKRHTMRDKYIRFNYLIAAVCAVALGAYFVFGTTAPAAQASGCLVVSQLPATGK